MSKKERQKLIAKIQALKTDGVSEWEQGWDYAVSRVIEIITNKEEENHE